MLVHQRVLILCDFKDFCEGFCEHGPGFVNDFVNILDLDKWWDDFGEFARMLEELRLWSQNI